MSLSIALANAGTGLTATARAIQVASGNVANAQTPGYSVRALQLTSATTGGQGSGVRVLGVERQVDPVLAGLMRSAGATRAEAEVQTGFWSAIEGALGVPGAPGSLTEAMGRLTGALVNAIDRPDLDNRLAAVVSAGTGVAAKLNALEAEVQAQRLAADTVIARDVAALDTGLARLQALGSDIAALRAAGQSTLDLEDERDRLLGTLSEIVPLRTLARPDGHLLVYTEAGMVLLDRQAADLEFQPAAAMTAGMTLAGGQLSGLTVNGRPVATDPGGPFAGGRLGAAFAFRDSDGPAMQAALDALARSLIARVEGPPTDPSAAPGTPGLFTDAGTALGASPAPGLAGRIALNPLVDPAAGGALWRLRDGLGGAAPGPVGDPAQLIRWLDALDRPVATVPGGPLQSLGAEVDALFSAVGLSSQAAADRASYAQAMETGLSDRALAAGVDIDAEMRRLLAIETAYAANARVIQAVDEMMKRLLEI